MGRKRAGFGTFLTGAMIGAGLGLLFAPKKGSETREDLKKKMEELIDQIKEIDYAEVKDNLLKKVDDLKQELKDLDKEKAIEIARIKANQIRKKAEELMNVAKEKGTPMVQKAAQEVKEKTAIVLKEVLNHLEGNETSEVISKPKKATAKK